MQMIASPPSAEQLEWKGAHVPDVRRPGQEADQRVHVPQGVELDDGEGRVGQRQQAHGDAKVSAIVEKGQEAWVEPRQRTNGEDDAEQHKRRGAEAPNQGGLERSPPNRARE